MYCKYHEHKLVNQNGKINNLFGNALL